MQCVPKHDPEKRSVSPPETENAWHIWSEGEIPPGGPGDVRTEVLRTTHCTHEKSWHCLRGYSHRSHLLPHQMAESSNCDTLLAIEAARAAGCENEICTRSSHAPKGISFKGGSHTSM